VEKLKWMQNHPQALFALDRDLGSKAIDLTALSAEISREED